MLVLIALAIIFISALVVKEIHKRAAFERKRLALIKRKRQQRDEKIQQFLRLHQPVTLAVDTETLSISQLQDAIRERSITCEQLMLFYCHKAIRANEQCNCLTDVMFTEALEQARQLDADFLITGRVTGPLHGIPVSVKENIAVSGTDTNRGVSLGLGRVAKTDSSIVEAVKKAGAIPFVKTNVPQLCLSFECSNAVWGTTTHPAHPLRSPGGSSGGEAALISSGASLVGLGNDLAGSLRVPAHFCGIYALKPTAGRFPYCGGSYGSDSLQPVNGPMGKNLQDLALISSILVCQPQTVPIPWRSVPEKKKLRIGVLRRLQLCPPTAACSRVVEQVAEKLKAAGSEIIPISLIREEDFVSSFGAIMFAEQLKQMLEQRGSDPIEGHLKGMVRTLGLPTFLKRAVARLLGVAGCDIWLCRLLSAFGRVSTDELWVEAEKRRAWALENLKKFEALQLDCIICPGFASSATTLGSFSDLNFFFSYTSVWNLLDVPVLAMPVGRVDEGDLGARVSLRRAEILPWIAHRAHKDHVGMPLGIQLVSPSPFSEENLFSCARVIESEIKK